MEFKYLRVLLLTFLIVAGAHEAASQFPESPARQPDPIDELEKQAKPITPDNPIPPALRSPTPRPPTLARRTGVGATVTLRVLIDRLGRVVYARTIAISIDECTRALPNLNLEVALAAFRSTVVATLVQWEFEPPANPPIAVYAQFAYGPFLFDEEVKLSSDVPPQRVEAPCPPAQQALGATILPRHSLASDGDRYLDGSKGVRAYGQYAITFCTDPRSCTTLPEDQPAEPSQRAVLLDLSVPVAASGATNRGIVRAAAANVGAFWGQDRTQRAVYNRREGWVIRSVLDMEVGKTIESERVEIRFFVDGVQHVLQFGPWTAGQYQAAQGDMNGDGTTSGTIARVSATRWRVQSGRNSVGRLWDNRDSSRPVDLGLYRFSYDVQFDRQ